MTSSYPDQVMPLSVDHIKFDFLIPQKHSGNINPIFISINFKYFITSSWPEQREVGKFPAYLHRN